MPSEALNGLHQGLRAVDDVLGYASGGPGRPTDSERSLFVASVALSYAVWENYIEEVAIEVTKHQAQHCPPGSVPETVRTWITTRANPKPDAWDLAVHPGWRVLWVTTVENRARGDSNNERDYGLLTADKAGVLSLFERVGVSPFEGVAAADQDKLDALVRQRGSIVHTGRAPEGFYKQDATAWRAFVESLSARVDESVSNGAFELTGVRPW